MSLMKNNIKVKVIERTLKNEEEEFGQQLLRFSPLQKLSKDTPKRAPKIACTAIVFMGWWWLFGVMIMGVGCPPHVYPFIIIATALLVNRILVDLDLLLTLQLGFPIRMK